jgi:hypothetical protein
MGDATQQLLTVQILETVLSNLSPPLPPPPTTLYHYSSLEAITKIIQSDNVRLSHAEYSNDNRELKEAVDLIRQELKSPRSGTVVPAFFGPVESNFNSKIAALDVYVFCMCAGVDPLPDLLSQWRAYAQDGRGGALALDKKKLDAIVLHMPGLRINPVFYDATKQKALVQAILNEGLSRYSSSASLAIDATVDALIYSVPLMKHEGFRQEAEWRLIYLPISGGTPATIGFHPRRDFLAPFLELQNLWVTVGPSLPQIVTPPLNVPKPSGRPLLPIVGVTVGPSLHQDLNVRAVNKVVSQQHLTVTVNRSEIPYRSIT